MEANRKTKISQLYKAYSKQWGKGQYSTITGRT